MRVELFRDCILNNKYEEVFATNRAKEQYFNALRGGGKNLVFNVDDAYITFNGEIYLDITNISILTYCYNYIIFYSGQISYCFINSIRIVNDGIVINYSLDFWNTFMGTWNLRDSLMINTMYPVEYTHYDYNVKPLFNKPPIITQQGEYENQYQLIVEIQPYDLVVEGRPALMYGNFLCAVKDFDGTTFVSNDEGYTRFLNPLIKAQSMDILKFLDDFGTDKRHYYKLVNAYFVPRDFGLDVNDDELFIGIDKPDVEGEIYFRLYSLNYSHYTKDSRTYIIQPNINIASVGFYSKQFPYSFNGLEKEVKFTMEIAFSRFNVYMEYEGNREDITDLFQCDRTFDVADASSLAQQQISKNMKELSAFNNIAQGIGGITGVRNFQDVTSFISPLGNLFKTSSGTSFSGGVGALSNLAIGIDKLILANSKTQSNFTSTGNNSDALLNAIYSFFAYTLDEEDIINKDEIENCIKSIGYKVNYFTSSLKPDNLEYRYNYVKFAYVRLVGVNSEVGSVIEGILTNGVRLWYDGDFINV